MLLRIIYFVLFVSSINASKAPFIAKCKAEDSKCLKQSAQVAVPIFAAGIPELGVESLDPIFFEKLDGSSSGITLKLYNYTGTGLKDCIVKKLQRDVSQSKLTLQLLCDFDFRGLYELDGQVLILHMEGKGDSRVVLKKILITVDAELGEKVDREGQKHWNIKTFQYTYDLLERAIFDLQNLFDGNEVLAKAARQVLNDSSNELIKEIGTPIVRPVVVRIVQNVKTFFNNVPIKDLSLDY